MTQRVCKDGLKCVFDRCRSVVEGDSCSQDAQCSSDEMSAIGLGMVCINSKCDSKREAGETCEFDVQCISGQCSGGRCVGAGLNEPCVLEGDDVITMAGSQLTFTPGQNVRYQNTCGVYEGVALYCELKHEGGVQKSVCSLPKKVHETCFAYEIDLQLLSKANNHTYVSNAMLASMYSGCEGGSICFVDVHLKGLTFTGECRPMFATLPGETCLEDHECEPPYRCIGGTATQYGTCSSNSVCGADDDWRCSQNERCQCADEGTGAGKCVAYMDECPAQWRALTECMVSHGCPLVDNGETTCVKSHCRAQDLAVNCCAYEGPFDANVDWPALQRQLESTSRVCSAHLGVYVSGLCHGHSITLRNTGADGEEELSANQNGEYRFERTEGPAQPYAVAVATQPLMQSCVVEEGVGVTEDSDVKVNVVCKAYVQVAAELAEGYGGGALRVRLNGKEELTFAKTGVAAFTVALAAGAAYNVSVAASPGGLTCAITSGVGTVGLEPPQATVTCGAPPPPSAVAATLDDSHRGAGTVVLSVLLAVAIVAGAGFALVYLRRKSAAAAPTTAVTVAFPPEIPMATNAVAVTTAPPVVQATIA